MYVLMPLRTNQRLKYEDGYITKGIVKYPYAHVIQRGVLIVLVFFLHAVNAYSALLMTAFAKKRIFGCTKFVNAGQNESDDIEIGKGNCMHELELLLSVVFLARIISNLSEIGMPMLKQWIKTLAQKRGDKRKSKVDFDRYSVEYECTLDIYENTYEDYAEMVVQVFLIVWLQSSSLFMRFSTDYCPCSSGPSLFPLLWPSLKARLRLG